MPAPRLRVLAKLTGVLIVTGVLVELATRAVVLTDVVARVPAAGKLRRPDAYAHPEEDLYWWLRVHFELGPGPQEAANYHTELGWTPWPTETFAHPQHGSAAGRRAVLLYGDSFSACVTPPQDCFQGLMDRSVLGVSHVLLNYGAHAYGVDQISMLIERSIDRFEADDPVVVVGILVDRDLDRAALTFRGTQSKPRLDLEDGQLVLRPPLGNGVFPAMPATLLAPRLVAHFLPVPEWTHELACGRGAERERNARRCAVILESIVSALEARGLESFFLLFHSEETLLEPTWEDELVTSTLDGLGARWYSTRELLIEHARVSGRELASYFDRTGHLNALGNSIAFRALYDGLTEPDGGERAFAWSPDDLGGPLSPSNYAHVRTGGPRGVVRYQFGARPAFRDPSNIARLFFSVDAGGPTEATYALNGRASSFSATALFYPRDSVESGSVGLTLLVDGEVAQTHALVRAGPPLFVKVDLRGREEMTLRVDDGGDGVRGDWLVLSSPRFELTSPDAPAANAGHDESQ